MKIKIFENWTKFLFNVRVHPASSVTLRWLKKNETFLNHSEPILKCVYSLPVTFEILNQGTSKPVVSAEIATQDRQWRKIFACKDRIRNFDYWVQVWEHMFFIVLIKLSFQQFLNNFQTVTRLGNLNKDIALSNRQFNTQTLILTSKSFIKLLGWDKFKKV